MIYFSFFMHDFYSFCRTTELFLTGWLHGPRVRLITRWLTPTDVVPPSGYKRHQFFLLLHRQSALHRRHSQHDVAPHHLRLLLHRRQLLVGIESRVLADGVDVGANHLWSLGIPSRHDLPNRLAPMLLVVGSQQLKRCPQSILQGFKLGKVRVRRRLHLPLPINFLTLNNIQRIIIPHSSCLFHFLSCLGNWSFSRLGVHFFCKDYRT